MAPVRTDLALDDVADLVRRVVEDELSWKHFSIKRQPYGHGSTTYAVRTEEDVCFVRTSVDPAIYLYTEDNLVGLSRLGLPVPRVLAADLSRKRYPFAYLITDGFPGRDLRFEVERMRRDQLRDVAALIVEFERRVGDLPEGDGFGFGALGSGGPHRTWIDAIRADRDIASTNTPWTERTLAALDRAEARLAAVEATCFLDDLTTKNVIVSAGRLSGVVDFDVVCFGDPMYWLALARVAMLYDVGRPGELYVDELRRAWDPSPDEELNLNLYSTIHGCEFASWGRHDQATGLRLGAAMESWLRDS